MKRNILFLAIALVVLVGCVAPQPAAPAEPGAAAEATAAPAEEAMDDGEPTRLIVAQTVDL